MTEETKWIEVRPGEEIRIPFDPDFKPTCWECGAIVEWQTTDSFTSWLICPEHGILASCSVVTPEGESV
jgi:hypothetical protein